MKYFLAFLMMILAVTSFAKEGKESVKELTLKCNQGNMKVCRRLGMVLTYGINTKINKEEGLKYLKKACDNENGDACYSLGILNGNGDGVPKNEVLAVTYFGNAYRYNLKECKNQDGYACVFIGLLYEKGLGTNQDLFKAKEYYKKACDLNSTAGCSDLALLKYGLATNTSHDSSNSQNNLNDFESLSKKACLDMKRTQSSEYIYKYISGKADGCFQVGQAKDLKKDYKNAIKFYNMACDLGLGKACSIVGVLYEDGSFGLKSNIKKANELYKKGCDFGLSGEGCYLLALRIERGTGIKQNLKDANILYERACLLGEGNACLTYADNLYDGNGVKQNEKLAKSYYKIACNYDVKKACELFK